MRIASDGGDRRGRAVFAASGGRSLALGDGRERHADPRQLYPGGLLLLLVMMRLLLLLSLLLLLLLMLLMLLMVTPLGHGVQSGERLAGEHAASGGAQVEKLENMRRGGGVEVVEPGWSRRRWRVAGCRWRRTRAQRGTRGGAPVALQVAVPPVSVAQRRHVLVRLSLRARSRLQVRAGLLATGVVAALTTVVVVVIVGQRTHHLAPRIVRQ